eukprot:5782024-Alexandrium_andersonii.AAC.1
MPVGVTGREVPGLQPGSRLQAEARHLGPRVREAGDGGAELPEPPGPPRLKLAVLFLYGAPHGGQLVQLVGLRGALGDREADALGGREEAGLGRVAAPAQLTH